ncbi:MULTISPECIES: ribosome small subunit-dependent GTPase A [Shouchella]|uniref:Small ribosomal subunit biogenesis GTPase RsgA n=2 Tax=Shouchella TaxID=2893057 RepID=A0ABY7W4G2_9BACI|nr:MULTISPECIES: ribosome small subunit-dependent GTPase A [Shouchella]MED4127345.1 ribosome small subunit-dependent GTPase A [Shouchella miscanthi]WDF03818.1 ribosome small subunit-dependent GTPase A [Shouchella hunanensis]GAF22169.1 ribosome small subunit-stimulated GTPase EngC [Bacillus sp. JCM 19047]
MPSGLIMKALAGYYYVYDKGTIIQCRARGVFRKQKRSPLVGDHVEYQAENVTDGYIMDIQERSNELVRPPIANVDQAFLLFSVKEPDFSAALLDRFLVHIERQEILPIIIVTKMDLLTNEEKRDIQSFVSLYEKIGYQVRYISSKAELDFSVLTPLIKDNVTVIAGQSGVGKSSFLNLLKPGMNLETNEISSHLGRGKHTTRHVELIEIEQGLIADTPGFSSLDFEQMEQEELRFYFPEFVERMDECKFRGCLHDKEPGCGVKRGLEEGEIQQSRYDNYLQFLEEVKSQKRRY